MKKYNKREDRMVCFCCCNVPVLYHKILFIFCIDRIFMFSFQSENFISIVSDKKCNFENAERWKNFEENIYKQICQQFDQLIDEIWRSE